MEKLRSLRQELLDQGTYNNIIIRNEHEHYKGFVKVALFVNTGQFGDGRQAYSILDENGKIVPEDDGMYYQMRHYGKLVMVRL